MPGASPIGSAQAASPNQSAVQGPGGWHPTILYLLLLIVVEVAVIGWLLRLTGGRLCSTARRLSRCCWCTC
jgi:hypothetical protein